MLRPEIKYGSPSDLNGLKIATFPPESIQHTLLRNWLYEHDIDHDADLDPHHASTIIATEVLKYIDEWEGSWISEPEVIVNPTLDCPICNTNQDISKPLTRDYLFGMSFYELVMGGE